MVAYRNALVSLLVLLTLVVAQGQPIPLHAAACTNSYGSRAAAPVGYGAAWNPFTAARELLVQGTDCTTSTGTMKVGSGNAAQYVYNKGYYWTGTEWQQYNLTGTSELLSNAWYTGSAAGNITLASGVTYAVGYACQQQGGAWKCGCRDSSCATAYWQLQGVKGAPAARGGGGSGDYATGGPQCDPSLTPAPAKATGLTKLAFCDDFSDINKSFDLTGAYWNPNVKWSRRKPFGKNILQASDISVSDGVLKLNGTSAYGMMTSTLKDGKVQGYSITKEKEWYVEIKWRFGANYKKPVGQIPCFWSMDNCWLWKSPLCQGPFIEPDFYEPIDGNDAHGTHFHHWDSTMRMKKLIGADGWKAGFAGDYTQWHTRALHVNPNQHEGRQVYYYNEKVQLDRSWTDKNCKETATRKNVGCDFLKDLDQGSYPLMINPGVGTVLYVDYVRVWVKP